MSKILVSYFSASGITKRVAEKMAMATGGDLFEIEPAQVYTNDDLDWTDKQSRSSRELRNRTSRPKLANELGNMGNYDIVAIGFPVWWNVAPTIINTFIESNNLMDKKIYIFVTSGGSSEKGSFRDLKETYPDLNFVDAKRFKGNESNDSYTSWLI